MPSSIKICSFESCCEERIKRDVKDRVQYMHESGVSLKQKLHTEHASDALLHTEGAEHQTLQNPPNSLELQEFNSTQEMNMLGSCRRKLSLRVGCCHSPKGNG